MAGVVSKAPRPVLPPTPPAPPPGSGRALGLDRTPDATRGMPAVNVLHVAAASTAASAAALQWWAASVLDEAREAGDGGDWLAAVLRSRVTVALLANLAAHVFLLIILGLKVSTSPLV